MGDPADPAVPHGPTKLALARIAMSDAIDQLAPDDEVGLRIFSTGLGGDRNWADVVPIGPLATATAHARHHDRRAGTASGLAALRRDPRRVRRHRAARRPGPDRRSRDPDRRLQRGRPRHESHRAARASRERTRRVRVFTIAYSNDADQATLRKIAQATNAGSYDARDTRDLADVLPARSRAFSRPGRAFSRQALRPRARGTRRARRR